MGHDSWDDMINDIDEQYQKMMRILEKRSLAKKADDGFYTITKSGTELLHNVLNSTILKPENMYRFRNWQDNYQEYKDYQEFMERVGQMIQSSAAIQTMYKTAISQVHFYQFLTRTLDYLEMDTDVKGVSKLSPYVTQLVVDGMWGMFGRLTPLAPGY